MYNTTTLTTVFHAQRGEAAFETIYHSNYVMLEEARLYFLFSLTLSTIKMEDYKHLRSDILVPACTSRRKICEKKIKVNNSWAKFNSHCISGIIPLKPKLTEICPNVTEDFTCILEL